MSKDHLGPPTRGAPPPALPSSPALEELGPSVEQDFSTRIHSSTASPMMHVLRLPDVCRVTGLCCSMIYQLEADRKFPAG